MLLISAYGASDGQNRSDPYYKPDVFEQLNSVLCQGLQPDESTLRYAQPVKGDPQHVKHT